MLLNGLCTLIIRGLMLLNGLCALIVRGLMYFTSSVCLKSEVIIGVSFDGSGPIKKGEGGLLHYVYIVLLFVNITFILIHLLCIFLIYT